MTPVVGFWSALLLTLASTSAAWAADFGIKKPLRDDYVKTCPAYGAGFFVVPGTTSCLKVGGRVRAEYIFDNSLRRVDNANRLRSRGYLILDHRVATDYGLLRTFVRGYIQSENETDNTPVLDFAFVQFAGFSAGRMGPLFSNPYVQFFSRSGQYFGPVGLSDDNYVNGLSYTHTIAPGYTAAIAVETQTEKRAALQLAPGVALSAGQTTLTGGQSTPDVTVAFEGKQSIFQGKVAAALHPIRGTFVQVPAVAVGEDYGFAIFVGGKVDLSAFRKGSNIWASFNYSEGAPFYSFFLAGTGRVASRQLAVADAVVDANGRLQRSRTWSVGGAAETTVIPDVVAAVGAFYGEYDRFGPNNTARLFTLAGHLSWRPAFGGFLVGTEVLYQTMSNRGTVLAPGGGTGNASIIGRVRVQRDF